VNVINADGGVLCKKVNLVTQDDASDPGDAISAAESEINSSHIVAFMGPPSATASVVETLADRSKIPEFMWGGGAAFDFNKDPYLFRVTPSDSEQAAAIIDYAKQKGWTHVAFATGNEPADQSLLPSLQQYVKQNGMTVTASVAIDINATSYRSEIQKIYSTHPQVVIGQFAIPSAGVFFSEVKQQGLGNVPFLGGNLWYAAEFPKAVSNAIASGPIYILNPASGSGENAFLKVLKATTGRTTANNGELEMWDAVNSWALGVQEAGTVASPQVEAGVIKAANGPGTDCSDFTSCLALLKAGKAINYQGAASTTDYNQYHNVFGDFVVVHYDADGVPHVLQTLPAKELEGS
jgi:ABC-type branched-subunit amino acid transport system substrate-binding protein